MTSGTNLYRALLAEGFELPKNCGDVEMELPVAGAIILRYRVFLDGEDLQKVGRALERMGKGASKTGPVDVGFPQDTGTTLGVSPDKK